MKTYIISIVPENVDLNQNENLATVDLDEERGVTVYQDESNGEILIPARTGLSFQHFRALIDKQPPNRSGSVIR